MSFTEMLENLETLTTEQRQAIIQRAIELEDAPLTPDEEKLIEQRLAEFRQSPESFITIDELEKRLQTPRES